MIQEQNRELELELERFLNSDNEIRTKLADRGRSPCMCDEIYPKAEKLEEEETHSEKAIRLQRCLETQLIIAGSERKRSGSPYRPAWLDNGPETAPEYMRPRVEA